MSNRSLMVVGGRARAFAPLDQRWITTSLAHLRELDVISQRRADALGEPPAVSKVGVEEDGGSRRKKPKAKAKVDKEGAQ